MGAGFGLLAWANHKQRTEAVSTVSADPESKPANVQHDRGPRRVKGRSAPEVYLPDENEKLQAEIERLNKEIERRDKKLQAIGHDYDQLRAELSDPTAKRQREEQMARERCLEVSDELFAFLQGRPFVDPAETVAAFKQRQQWKVDEVRDRMDDQGLLTQREREALTFRSDNQLDKIEAMVELLARLGQGG
jgi:hypothetical protein